MNFSAFLYKRICDLLDERRIVVWYDPEGMFAGFAAALKAPRCVVVSAAESILKARRTADDVFRLINESEKPEEARRNLLIYLPRRRRRVKDFVKAGLRLPPMCLGPAVALKGDGRITLDSVPRARAEGGDDVVE